MSRLSEKLYKRVKSLPIRVLTQRSLEVEGNGVSAFVDFICVKGSLVAAVRVLRQRCNGILLQMRELLLEILIQSTGKARTTLSNIPTQAKCGLSGNPPQLVRIHRI
jgi:hypothetical protein